MPPFFTHVIHWLRESQLKFYRRRSPSLCLPQIFLGPQMRGNLGFALFWIYLLLHLLLTSRERFDLKDKFPHSQRGVGFPLPRRQRFWDCNCDAECMPFSVICLGHLHLREVQFWVAMFGLDPVGHGVCRVQVTPECSSVPCHWQAPYFLTQGELIGTILSRNVIIMDPSSTGCVYEG